MRIEFFADGRLRLLTGKRDREGLHRLGPDPTFEWIREPEGWLEAAELVQPFLDGSNFLGARFQNLEMQGDARLILSTDRSW